jgi:hypothetical protein
MACKLQLHDFRRIFFGDFAPALALAGFVFIGRRAFGDSLVFAFDVASRADS